MIGILDLGIGNVGSIKSAISSLSVEPKLVKTPQDIQILTHLILPGVGSISAYWKSLCINKINEAIVGEIETKQTKVLGICIGMHVACLRSHEDLTQETMGLIGEEVISLKHHHSAVIAPHVGWNELTTTRPTGLHLEGDYYFDHNYCLRPDIKSAIAKTQIDNETTISSVVQYKSFTGCQFHPEKSGLNGLRFLRSFLDTTC